MKMCGMPGIALGVGLMMGFAVTAAAQTNDEVFPTLEWNFSTPGARANGMGRSFVGLADDATAAVTNPAGLLNLSRAQVYAEYKNTNLKVSRLAGPAAFQTLSPTANTSDINALSFLSASAPVGNKLAIAFSVQRFLDYRESFTLAPRAIPTVANRTLLTDFAFRQVKGQADFTGVGYGGSVAYRVTSGLRLGVTVAANQLKADSQADRYQIATTPTGVFVRDASGNIVSSDVIVNRTSIHDSKLAASASVGVQYRINEMVSVGAHYARSPKFKTHESEQVNISSTATPNFSTNVLDDEVQINVPDRVGFGTAIRPNTRLLIAADVVWIGYSSLSEATTLIFDQNFLNASQFSTPDATEIHVGAEYNVYTMSGNPIFVRGGVFTNPNHLVEFTPVTSTIDDVITANAAANAQYNLLPRKNETRGTFGPGIALGPRAQIDAAYVFGKEFVLSSAVRF